MIPLAGSKWIGNNSHTIFRVLDTIELDGHTWIHYCKENDVESNYSCYLESFLERFREVISS